MSTTQGDQALDSFKKRETRKRIRRFAWIGAFLLAIAAAAYFFFGKPDAAVVTIFRYATAERGDIVKAITATGTIQATKTVQVGTQVSGVVRELRADFNSKVKKGDLIAIIDPTFYEAAVKQADANYQKAVADLAKANLDMARAEQLFKSNLLAKADYDVAVTTLEEAKSTQKQAAASLDQAKVNLGYTQIRAPISGTVVSRNVDVGQTVAASLSAPVIFIIAEDLEKMQVWASVDEADIGGVLPGQEVTFTVDAYGDEKFHGVVNSVRLNATITQNVVNYTVIIDAANPDLKLLPSMTATVTIINSSKKDVIKLPVAALRFTPPNIERPHSGHSHQGGNGQKQGGNGSIPPQSPATASDSVVMTKGLVYVKSTRKGQDGSPQFDPVEVMTGISDGLYVEVQPVGKDFQPTDSIAIGMYQTGGGASAAAPGTSPFGNQNNNRSTPAMRRM